MKKSRTRSSSAVARKGGKPRHPRGTDDSGTSGDIVKDRLRTPIHEEIHAKGATSAENGLTLDWSLLSPEGHVIFLVALCPNVTVSEIASALGRTERSVWGVMQRLREAGMVRRRSVGRKHLYRIVLDAPLLHPTLRGLTLRPVVEDAISRARAEAPEMCEEIRNAKRSTRNGEGR